MQYTKKVLKNGLRLIVVPMESFESATVLVMVGAGARFENKQNNGISHFLEHMAFKGTEKRPSAIAIAGAIDGIGGEFNAFTDKEITGYYVKANAAHVELCIDILSDMLQNSKFDATELDKERGVIIEEINMYEDSPMQKLSDIYEELLYGDTPMGWDVAGTKDVIRSVKREDFLSYMNSLYSPSNMTVVVAGGVKVEEVEKMVEKYFSKMKAFDTVRYDKVIDSQEEPKVLLKPKKTEQVHIAVGVRTVSMHHEDRYALQVLASLLGGGMSSRLFEEVREKRGLAYYVYSRSMMFSDCGSFVSQAGVDPKRVKDAIEVIVAEYKRITKPGNITAQELKKAKEYLKGHFVLGLEDSETVANYYAKQEILEGGKLQTPVEKLEKIDSVTAEQVEKVAQKYFTEKTLNLAVIGNFEDGQEFKSLLKL
ncbi:MAG TPA: pitrilysin family protein [Patescibacteria group bacterium]